MVMVLRRLSPQPWQSWQSLVNVTTCGSMNVVVDPGVEKSQSGRKSSGVDY